MKIKKYSATTEQEAIENVKEDLGLNALILNIKRIQPRGVFSFLRKPLVEVTAAYDDKISDSNLKNTDNSSGDTIDLNEINNDENAKGMNVLKDSILHEQQEKITSLQKEVNNKQDLLNEVLTQLYASSYNSKSERKYDNNMVQVFYDALVEQGVTSDIAEKLLEDVNSVDDIDEININLIVKIVYNTIINILGEPSIISFDKNETKIIMLIGPTGVGKTTTIAKLSSEFILKKNAKVGFITADTYRIAAVEQLKTYAEILGIDVGVCYNNEDLEENVNKLKVINDVVFIDTAGRSHKNSKTLCELSEFLNIIPESEKYLVLSLTTKFEDLLNIINTYSSITDFKIIFTKLDETTCLGSILNICYLTNKKISYVTYGQSVPDDIEILKPDKIAKALLGFGGDKI